MIQFLAKNLVHPRVPLFFLIGSTLLIGINLPVHSSFWLDETLSAWVSNGTLGETIGRAATYQGQPPLYFTLLWLLQQLFEFSEPLLRVPSLVAGVACLGVLYLIARRYCAAETAAAAPLFIVANDEFHKHAISARPYTLALLMVLLSIFFVLKSQQRNSGKLLLVSGLSFTLSIYFHPLFFAFAPLLALFLYLERSPQRSYLGDFFVCATIVFVGLLPLVSQLSALADRDDELYFAAFPDAIEIILAVFPPIPVVMFLTAFICTAIFFKSFSFRAGTIPFSKIAFLLLMACTGPALYALHAHLTGHSLFLTRIMFWRLPALALIVSIIFEAVNPRLVRHFMLLVFSVLTVSMYTPSSWGIEDWKQAVATTTGDPHKRTAVYSGLIELDQLDWVKNPLHHDYLTAPFSTYAPDYKNSLVLPRDPLSPDAREYIVNKIVPALQDGDSLVMIRTHRQNGAKYPVHEVLVDIFKDAGLSLTPISIDGLVLVYTFSIPPDVR